MTETPAPLSSHEFRAALLALPAWSGDAEGIHRAVEASSFLAGIDLIRRVAGIAEEMNHHPDIDIRWRHLAFRLTTHDAGGVTGLDLALARHIEALISEQQAAI